MDVCVCERAIRQWNCKSWAVRMYCTRRTVLGYGIKQTESVCNSALSIFHASFMAEWWWMANISFDNHFEFMFESISRRRAWTCDNSKISHQSMRQSFCWENENTRLSHATVKMKYREPIQLQTPWRLLVPTRATRRRRNISPISYTSFPDVYFVRALVALLMLVATSPHDFCGLYRLMIGCRLAAASSIVSLLTLVHSINIVN